MNSLKLSLALVALAVPAMVQAQTTKIKEIPVQGTQTLNGSELYNTYCAVCHGKDGKGGGPAADALKKRPTDLTQMARKNGGKFDSLRIQNMINGLDVIAAHGSRDMPTWGTVFGSMNPDEGTRKIRISSLIDYIEKMQAK